ncbi:aminodeoxychorismate lyase [Sulfuriflexus sp.]|uniref:aminodeoxychorismate lyase n=1 Tax=Sulfuriflexus sp. TaxID=2015443 RepID=UPI0028CF1A8E|nr:aminodeoxychorismate lyase [Sulfuriflexus sp.]MDT8404195.1 aminodeoxychorismate lyase [Sulfuriflexus sp.]
MMLINGVVGHELPATDRAVHYGDGVFETIAVFNGQPRGWHRHMQRLVVGCAKLGISQPDTGQLASEARQLYKDYGEGQARLVLKLIISRGSGGRGYRPAAGVAPTRIVALYPWPEHAYDWYKVGIRLHVCETRLACNPALAGIKHLNRLENILASSEWQDKDIDEGLMCNMQGEVIAGTMSNVFAVIDGSLHTPSLGQCGITGTMRARVIEAGVELGIRINERAIQLEELYEADELFVCNSILSIVAVRQLGEHHYAVPGVVTQRLAAITRERE